MSKKWQRLVPGDVVDIIAPGFKPDDEEFNQGLLQLVEWGLEPRYPKDIFGKDLLCAQSKSKRSQYFRHALEALDSKVIWCARGGYGSVQILEELEKMSEPKKVKLLIGYSDISVLHNYLIKKWDWPVLHGSLIDGLGSDRVSRTSIRFLRDALFKDRDFSYAMKPLNSQALSSQEVKGRVLGGNLAMMQTTLGTSVQVDLKDSILFLEDTGERGYKIERMLIHLAQATRWKGMKALVFGDFKGGDEPNGKNLIKKVMKRWAEQQEFPVFANLPCGHSELQHPLFLNTSARLVGGERGALWFSSGARYL